MVNIVCKICNKVFPVKNYRVNTALYCSTICYRNDPEWRRKVSAIHKGKTYNPANCFKTSHTVPSSWREKISQAHIGHKPWNIGIPVSSETRHKISLNRKGKSVGHTHGFRKGRTPWNKGKGTKCSEAELIRASFEYRSWRESVFKRDDFTCQICKQRGGRLNADHIMKFSEFPELRFELSNGRTLCISCHRRTPNFGNRMHHAS